MRVKYIKQHAQNHTKLGQNLVLFDTIRHMHILSDILLFISAFFTISFAMSMYFFQEFVDIWKEKSHILKSRFHFILLFIVILIDVCICVLKDYSLLSIQYIPRFLLNISISYFRKVEVVSEDV